MSAKRFGGAHSPGGPQKSTPPGAGPNTGPKPASRFSGRKASHFSWRVLGLYLAPSALLLPALEALFTADMPKVAWCVGAYVLFMLGAWLTGQGLIAEEAYNERVVAKPPSFPRKIVAAALIGLALLSVGWFGLGIGFAALFYGALGAGAHVLAFGLDPMSAKGGQTGVSDAELERVAEKIDQAEAVVAETVKTAEKIRDRGLRDRIDVLAYAARDILKEIQGDPRDLRRARKFLSVHLVGLRDATVKFVRATEKGAGDMSGEYQALLADLEASFAKQRETLLIDDKVDLEVEIEVLRDRLKQEGPL